MKIMSGGQTGADRAALDFAIASGIDHGGFVPRGRWAEDGRLPARYDVDETESADVDVRTELNVRTTDLTLILCHGAPTGGTLFTLECARSLGRPHKLIDLGETDIETAATAVSDWLAGYKPSSLNVAGPRASEDPTIYDAAMELLVRVRARGGFDPISR
jgi:hypothetical protein